jgi:hypothetical protein
MQFFFESPEAEARATDYVAQYRDVTFACVVCGSENTEETDTLIPSGSHYKVRCEEGHVTNGMPPKAFRNQR